MIQDRLSFMRFLGLGLSDRVPDAKTIWLFREHLAQARAVENLFARFDKHLAKSGYLAMGGQIVDATIVAAPKQHQQPLSFWLRDKWRSAFNPHRDTWCRLYGDIHISGFDKHSLRRTVESAGFETYFIRTTEMWSRYYDPFFFSNYWRNRSWNQLVRKALRHALDKVGVAFGKGDWVIGYFKKTDLPRSVSKMAANAL